MAAALVRRLGRVRGSRIEKQERDGLWRELGGKSDRIWKLAARRVGEGREGLRVTQSFPPG